MDKQAGAIFCKFEEDDLCYDMEIEGNSVAGAHYTGYGAPGSVCGETKNITFKDNIVHSTDGTGVIFYWNQADDDQLDDSCFEGSYVTAYKTAAEGVIAYQGAKNVILSNNIIVDTGYGITALVGTEGSDLSITIKDS